MILLGINLPNCVQFKQYYGKAKYCPSSRVCGGAPPSGNYAWMCRPRLKLSPTSLLLTFRLLLHYEIALSQ